MTDNEIYYMAYFADGAYFCITFLGGLQMAFNIMGGSLKTTPLHRMCGFAMLLDAATILLANAIYLFDIPISDCFYSIWCCVDGLTIASIPLIGETLIHDRIPSWRHIGWMVLPYFILAAIQVVVGHNIGILIPLGVFLISIALYAHTLTRLYLRERRLKECYADRNHRDAKWFFLLSVPIIIDLCIWFYITSTQSCYVLNSICYSRFMVVMWVLICRFVLHQNLDENIAQEEIEASIKKVEEKQGEEPKIDAKLLDRLMKEDKLYHDSNLSAAMLAQRLGTNRTYLSQYLSTQLQTNFYDFVNQYRIDEALQRLNDTEDTIETIGFDCGYNSTRSFTRVFKNIMGMTPTEWRNAPDRR